MHTDESKSTLYTKGKKDKNKCLLFIINNARAKIMKQPLYSVQRKEKKSVNLGFCVKGKNILQK